MARGCRSGDDRGFPLRQAAPGRGTSEPARPEAGYPPSMIRMTVPWRTAESRCVQLPCAPAISGPGWDSHQGRPAAVDHRTEAAGQASNSGQVRDLADEDRRADRRAPCRGARCRLASRSSRGGRRRYVGVLAADDGVLAADDGAAVAPDRWLSVGQGGSSSPDRLGTVAVGAIPGTSLQPLVT